MQDLVNNALTVLRGILRFRWVALLLAFSISVSAWAFVYSMPDVYQANARVFVDTNRVLQPLLKGVAIQPDLRERVRLMSRTLLSRPNLITIARASSENFDSLSDSEKESRIINLRANIDLAGERGNLSLYRLAFSSSERDSAKNTLNALIEVFIESSSTEDGNDSESAQVFLTKQLEINEKRLAESEKRLSDFKKKNSGRMPGEAGGYYQRLETAKNKLRNAELELLEAENRRDTFRRQISNERATVRNDDGVIPFSPLDETIQSQNNELASLLVRYTERHPRVAQLRESIAELEARKIRIQTQESSGQSGPSLDYIASPVYQEMRRQLTESEARVSELKVRVNEFGKQVNELNETVESIPKVEAELEQLDRGYNVVKKQYETLLNRFESARLSEQLEQNVNDVKIRVIDPPFVSTTPVGPPKLLMTAAAFIAALGAGAALAFLISLIKPVFYDPELLISKSGGVFLGTVSERRTKSRSLMSIISWISFCVVFSILCTVCLIMLAVHAGILDSELIADVLDALPQSIKQAFAFVS